MKFKSINLRDRARLLPFFSHNPQVSHQYTFGIFYTWNQGTFLYDFAIQDDILFLTAINSDTKKKSMFKPLSKHKQLTPAEIAQKMSSLNIEKLIMVDKAWLDQFSTDEWSKYFKITEDPDLADYYYLAENLANLKGAKFSKKRNLISQFNREQNNKTVSLEPIIKSSTEQIIEIQKTWMKSKYPNGPTPTLEREYQALIRSLKHFKFLELMGWTLKIDHQIIAFSIAEKINPETVLIHFEKTQPGIKGVGQVINQEVAKRLAPDFKYINRECDMGDSGLRQAKRSYHPIFQTPIYRLNLKSR